MDLHPAVRWGLPSAQWRNICLPRVFSGQDPFVGRRPMALRPSIDPKVARLVRLLQTLT
jgi:hypothetical protein